jgi:hypothetical protein
VRALPRQSPGIETTSSLAPETAAPARRSIALTSGASQIALAAAGVVAAVVVYARPLRTAPNYDEEVYLATLRELRHGVAIGDVFLSQPPGFGWFLDAVGTAAGTLEEVRGVMIATALLGCVAAWFIGRRAGGPLGGAIAAATLAVAPPWVVNASRIEAEVPSTTLAIAALALAQRFPLLAGAAFALAVSVKLLAVTVLVPIVLVARHGLRRLAVGATAAFAAVALSVAPRVREVWHQAILFHVDGRKTGAGIADNLHRVVHFFDLRTPFAALGAAALVVALILVRQRVAFEWALWTWPLTASAALVLQRPLFDHHMDVLAAAWAIPIGGTLAAGAGRTRGNARLAAAAAIGLAVAAGLAQQWRHNVAVRPSPDVAAAVRRLRALVPAGSLVATDHQIVPYLAGYREPPKLVDLSNVRLRSGELSRARLLADSADAKAFVVGRGLAGDRGLLAALGRRYAERVVVGSITIFAVPRP